MSSLNFLKTSMEDIIEEESRGGRYSGDGGGFYEQSSSLHSRGIPLICLDIKISSDKTEQLLVFEGDSLD